MNALKASRLVTGLAVLLTLAPMAINLVSLLMEKGSQIVMGFITTVIVGAWAAGPYLIAHYGARAHKDWKGAWVFPVTNLISAAAALGLYVDAFFFSKPDGQVALIFVLVPVYQYGLAIAVRVAVAILHRQPQPAAPAQ